MFYSTVEPRRFLPSSYRNASLRTLAESYYVANGIQNSKLNPSVGELDKICKIGDKKYVVCPNYCCGEFWESLESFCCTNNFKAIRNLFLFLLTALFIQFILIIICLLFERTVKFLVRAELRGLSDLYCDFPWSDIRSSAKDPISSDDTTLDEDGSIDERLGPSLLAGGHKRYLYKHSQSFKDMSKLNSFRRNLAKANRSRKSDGTISQKSIADSNGSQTNPKEVSPVAQP